MDTTEDSDRTVVDLSRWKKSRSQEESPVEIPSVMELLERLREMTSEDPMFNAIEEDYEEISRDDVVRLSMVASCLDDMLGTAFSCHAVIADDELWQRVSAIRHHVLEIEKWANERLI